MKPQPQRSEQPWTKAEIDRGYVYHNGQVVIIEQPPATDEKRHDWKSDGPIVQFLDARNHIRSINVGSAYAAEQLVEAHNRESTIQLRIGKNANIVQPPADKATAFCSKLDAAIEAENLDTAPRGEQEWTRESVLAIAKQHIGADSISDAVAAAHNAALAAERENLTLATQMVHIESERANVAEQRLLSAEAAIEEHNKSYCSLSRPIIPDPSALHKHDAEVRKPLVDALRGLVFWLKGSLDCKLHVWEPDQRDIAQALVNEADALAKGVK